MAVVLDSGCELDSACCIGQWHWYWTVAVVLDSGCSTGQWLKYWRVAGNWTVAVLLDSGCSTGSGWELDSGYSIRQCL